MQATKYSLTIEASALSKDVFYALVVKALEEMDNEIPNGRLSYDDGDSVMWNIDEERVEF